jgi:hypothetical protein
VKVWRPIRGPVLDSPLALCDARSFTDDDLIASDLVYQHIRGETSSVTLKPGHRWYYFSEQQPDEVVLIRVHDSATDGRARLSFHTSFENPLAPADAPPRESIEVRTLVFFPPNARPWTRGPSGRQLPIVFLDAPSAAPRSVGGQPGNRSATEAGQSACRPDVTKPARESSSDALPSLPQLNMGARHMTEPGTSATQPSEKDIALIVGGWPRHQL